MESPQHIGDATTSSIANQLYDTHLHKHGSNPQLFQEESTPTVALAVYSGQKFIQLTTEIAAGKKSRVTVLRRVQDSYVNVSQMLQILVRLGQYTPAELDVFFRNEIITNTQYLPELGSSLLPLFNDFSLHEVLQIRGLWVPFDKAILLAVKFDIYRLVKHLFLVDVHDFDSLPKAVPFLPPALKRVIDDAETDVLLNSPTKKRKTSHNGHADSMFSVDLKALVAANTNHPYTLPPLPFDETHRELIAEAKLLFNEIFKAEEIDDFTREDIKARFKTIFEKCAAQNLQPSAVLDVPLDQRGKTALHYAATLACAKLAHILINLKVCSPVRGDNKGESALVATLQVTNAMVKGNFSNMLDAWLWPGLWLFDSRNQSFLHYLVQLAGKNNKSSRFYLGKILEWIMASSEKKQHLDIMCNKIVNAQETKSGNTALHIAGEQGLKWHVYLLLELNADASMSNGMGVKPTDFACVNQVADARKLFKTNTTSLAATAALLEALDSEDAQDEYLILLVHTGVEFWRKLIPFADIGVPEDTSANGKELTPTSEVSSSSLLSNKIYKSIQDLLHNTNEEYERVIHAKKTEINSLNRQLRDATIETANNRLIAKNIAAKMAQVDTMKLQMMNINDKMQMLKRELSSLGDEDADNTDWDLESQSIEKYDADEPFIIREIFEKLVNGEEPELTPEVVQALPPLGVLRARLQAYEEVNANLEKELESLVDYSALTAQFKKVVSSCTGVDINEVDELLDGLLEAVESQQ